MSKIVFRVDASLVIGIGHVMRCLALANAMRDQGAECAFICRKHAGHLAETIQSQGHAVYLLALGDTDSQELQLSGRVAHADWLGATQNEDIKACSLIVRGLQPDWVVVDHYALDIVWETALNAYCEQLMVIDDLADRRHDCAFLLDQNLGRSAWDYEGLVPTGCSLLIGPKYALLRPEFAALRDYSLVRRNQQSQLKRLLVTMGGVDAPNATGLVLDALRHSALPEDCMITVVMGREAPHLTSVQVQVALMPWMTEVCIDIHDMAQRMADSDLCIGAAGSTSWERCCLGLPSVMVVLADNQLTIAAALSDAGAAAIAPMIALDQELPRALAKAMEPSSMRSMSQAAGIITDGSGLIRVSGVLIDKRWGS